jgi:hypothetical protein
MNNPLIYSALLMYIIWLAVNFRNVGYICITDILENLYKVNQWSWEPIFLSGIALTAFAINNIILKSSSVSNKEILLLSGYILVYILFIVNMIQSCNTLWYENVFYLISSLVALAFGLDVVKALRNR